MSKGKGKAKPAPKLDTPKGWGRGRPSGYKVGNAGYARTRTPQQRKHVQAKSVGVGMLLVGVKAGACYEVKATAVNEQGRVVLTVLSKVTGETRTWLRKPEFYCEYI